MAKAATIDPVANRQHLNPYKAKQQVWITDDRHNQQVGEVLTPYTGADTDDPELVRCCVKYWDGKAWVQTGIHIRDLMPKY